MVPEWLAKQQSEFPTCVEVWQEATRKALSHKLTPEQENQLKALVERRDFLEAECDELEKKYSKDADDDDVSARKKLVAAHRKRFSAKKDIYKFLDQYGFGNLTVEQDGCVGLKSLRGEMVVPAIYEDICLTYDRWLVYCEHFYVVKKNGKWGIIDESQEVLIPFEYDCIFRRQDFHSYYILIKDGKQGVASIDFDRIVKIGVPVEMDAIYDAPDWNLYLFTKDGKWGWWFEEDEKYYKTYSEPRFEKIYVEPFYETDEEEVTFIAKDEEGYHDILFFTTK